jgi:hypothetical protein
MNKTFTLIFEIPLICVNGINRVTEIKYVDSDPMDVLQELKRRTFSDVFDEEFRRSEARNAIKHIYNNGGTIKIKIHD